jgi:hypothetical protein
MMMKTLKTLGKCVYVSGLNSVRSDDQRISSKAIDEPAEKIDIRSYDLVENADPPK